MGTFKYNTISSNAANAYTDNKPIIDYRNKGDKIMSAADLDCGSFEDFGYLNSYTTFNKDIGSFITSLNTHFEDLNKRINSLKEALK